MKKVILIVFSLLLISAGAFRVYQVNTADYMDMFPKRESIEKNQEVALESGHYYFTSYDWTWYTIEVTGSSIVRTDDFLKEHNAPAGFLEDKNLRDNLHYKNDGLLIVHTVFRYNGTDSKEKSPINLAEFQLLGPDYFLQPACELNDLQGYNEILNGKSVFAITSGNPIPVDIGFLFTTSFESGFSEDYILSSDPGLLVTYDPTERVISIN